MTMGNNSQSKNWPSNWECIPAELTPGKPGVLFCGNPLAENTTYGKAMVFDGEDDAVFIADNPLKGLASYTIEVLMRPDMNGPEEQRFVHIGEADSDRLLLETRQMKDGSWYLDTFVLSGTSRKALLDTTLLHPAGSWYSVVLTIGEDGEMTNYVNGIMELRGKAESHLIGSGEMSIGCRRNMISWFKGAILKIRISPGVLSSKDFMTF
jgi:hypothetical protein